MKEKMNTKLERNENEIKKGNRITRYLDDLWIRLDKLGLDKLDKRGDPKNPVNIFGEKKKGKKISYGFDNIELGDLGDPKNPINIFEEKKKEVKISSETKFCSNCGAKIDVKAEICPKCGVRVASPLKESPQGGARLLLYIISLLIPLIGIIIGVIYLTKSSQDVHDVGVRCLIIGILHPVFIIISLMILYVYNSVKYSIL